MAVFCFCHDVFFHCRRNPFARGRGRRQYHGGTRHTWLWVSTNDSLQKFYLATNDEKQSNLSHAYPELCALPLEIWRYSQETLQCTPLVSITNSPFRGHIEAFNFNTEIRDTFQCKRPIARSFFVTAFYPIQLITILSTYSLLISLYITKCSCF